MNVTDIVILESLPCEAVCCPRVKGGTVFVAVMQGEVMLTLAGAAMLRLPACSLWYGPAVQVSSLAVGDDTLGVCWAVDAESVASPTDSRPQAMDELTAIVLQDAAFESPNRPIPMLEGASCSRTLEASLGYLSCRCLANDQQEECSEAVPDAEDAWVNGARLLMACSLDAPLTLADLAARLGCSPATLVRAFKAGGLPSPMRYLADLRVNHAKTSLLQSELSISNIAASLGFRDLATFSHFFRKHTGQSPRDYRLNCRWLL